MIKGDITPDLRKFQNRDIAVVTRILKTRATIPKGSKVARIQNSSNL